VRGVPTAGLISRLKPWIAPAIFLGCSLFLVWLNFFKSESGGGVETNPVVTPAALGTIELGSQPPGAEIYINDQLFGTTPVTLELEGEKDQRFLFRLEGYKEKEMTIFVSQGENRALNATLEPERATLASLRITSNPPGAAIYLNGESTGKRTPFTFDDYKRSDEVVVRLFKRGFAAEEATVLLDRESVDQDFVLKRKSASLKIKTEPAGALVLVDGNRVGSSPVTAQLKMNKNVRIVAKIEGYQNAVREMVVKEAQETISLTLTKIIPEYGYVSINADPWAVVYLDGKLLGNTPILKAKVTVGKHRIELQHADYGKKVHTVEVTKSNSEENPLLVIKDLKE
jgi:hypothetical protein